MATQLEKRLCAALVVAILLIPISAITIYYLGNLHRTTCTSTECLKSALRIKENMDESVRPCNDFYKFACGNYLKNTIIPEDKVVTDAFDIVDDIIDERLRIILEEPLLPNEIKPFVYAKQFYKSCMNTTFNNIGILKGIFDRLGGWPVLEGVIWRELDFDWKILSYELERYGFVGAASTFFNILTDTDYLNSSQRILEINEGSLDYIEYFKEGINSTVSQAYYKLMVETAVLFGAEEDYAKEEFASVIDFVVQLAKNEVPVEERRLSPDIYKPRKLKDLQEQFPFIPWVSYFNNHLLDVVYVDENTVVNVPHPSYIERQKRLISRYSSRTIANYMFFSAVVEYFEYVSEELAEAIQKFSQAANGNSQRSEKWKQCTEVAKIMSKAVDALYVRQYVSPSTKTYVEEIIDNIKGTFIDLLRNTEWMDEQTKLHAKTKAEKLTKYVGYPEELLNNSKLTNFYQNLHLDFNNYLLARLNVSLFDSRFEIGLLNEPAIENDWRNQYDAIDVNAYYKTDSNSMHFPAGILQDVFFEVDRPQFLNYGGIGYLIGHEITHGFDDEGKHFDGDGNLKDWWNPNTNEAYLKKAQCIIDQYSNYTVPEIAMHLEGFSTQGENIADNGGIKIAYLAYKKWAETNGPDDDLPGLTKYTPLQMFWLTAATSWCSKYRTEFLKYMVISEVHAPNQYRILIPFANSKYFAEDFDCPLGSKMNPRNKCKLW